MLEEYFKFNLHSIRVLDYIHYLTCLPHLSYLIISSNWRKCLSCVSVEESDSSCSDEPVETEGTPDEDSVLFVLPFEEVKFSVSYNSELERCVMKGLSMSSFLLSKFVRVSCLSSLFKWGHPIYHLRSNKGRHSILKTNKQKKHWNLK